MIDEDEEERGLGELDVMIPMTLPPRKPRFGSVAPPSGHLSQIPPLELGASLLNTDFNSSATILHRVNLRPTTSNTPASTARNISIVDRIARSLDTATSSNYLSRFIERKEDLLPLREELDEDDDGEKSIEKNSDSDSDAFDFVT